MELQINQLTKKYGEKPALDGFTYRFREGICGILGANGAGKSTLMHLITDNVSRTAGEILLDGTEVLKLGDSFRALLGFMPQQQGLYEGMTCESFRAGPGAGADQSDGAAAREDWHLLRRHEAADPPGPGHAGRTEAPAPR